MNTSDQKTDTSGPQFEDQDKFWHQFSFITFFAAILTFVLLIRGLNLHNYFFERFRERAENQATLKANHFTFENFQKSLNVIDLFFNHFKNPVLIGSSELSQTYEYDQDAFHPCIFYNNFDLGFTPLMIGNGWAQSFFSLLLFANLEVDEKLPIVIIISPQWFEKSMGRTRTLRHVSMKWLVGALLNSPEPFNSYIHKRLRPIIQAEDDLFLNLYLRVYNTGAKGKALSRVFKPLLKLKHLIYDLGEKYALFFYHDGKFDPAYQDRRKKLTELDYDEFEKRNLAVARQRTTNNRFGIYNKYFNEWVRDKYERVMNGGDYGRGRDYLITENQEWDDFEKLCEIIDYKQLNVVLIIPPFNRQLFKALNFNVDNQDEFYGKLKEIAGRHKVAIKEYSDKSDELYYLRDAMHTGWRMHIELIRETYEHFRK
ncbi:D-alanyl-lipoteichoic acid biosynthesis protein DltD [Fibrobacterota bacterium]